MGSLADFYTQAVAKTGDDRRFAVGAAYRLNEYVQWGYSTAAAKSLVLASPKYAGSLTRAALTAAYNAIDSFPAGPANLSSAANLFATTGSPWRQAIPAGAAIAADSATQLSALNALRTAAGRGAWIESGDYSSPIYVVSAGAPRVPMKLMTAADLTVEETQVQNGTDRQHLAWQLQQGVPLTDAMTSAWGTDAHMVVVDGGTGEMWDLFTVWRDGGAVPWFDANWSSASYRHAHWGTGTWRTWYGGYIADHRNNIGQYQDLASPKQFASWGSTATSLPVAAGMILESEIQAGVIPHALQMLIPNALVGHNWPAQRDDGLAANDATWGGLGLPPTVKEGTILRLKSTVPDAVTTGYGTSFDAVMQMVRVALKAYGAVINDRSGAAISFRAEPTQAVYTRFNPGGWDPWPAPYSDALLAAGLPAFNTTNWEVIDPAYRPAGAVGTPLLASITDDFAAASPDPAKWVVTAGVTNSAGQMHAAATAAYPKADTTPAAKLTASKASVQAVTLPTGVAGDQGGLSVVNTNNANCKFDLFNDQGTLTATFKFSNNVSSNAATAAYSATSHKWLRIREAGGTIFWEVSADGTTWNAFASTTIANTGWDPTLFDSMKAELWCGNFNGTAGRPDAVFDNFNL